MIHYNDENSFGHALKGIVICLVILCGLLFLSSCATPQNAETKKEIDYSGDFRHLQSQVESLRTDVSKQLSITTDKLSNLKVENRTVFLSPPDSTGKQHVVQESTTTAAKEDQERQQVNETITASMQQLTTRVDSLMNKVDTLIKEQGRVVQLSWWDLHKDKVYAAVLILIVVLVVLKRKQ